MFSHLCCPRRFVKTEARPCEGPSAAGGAPVLPSALHLRSLPALPLRLRPAPTPYCVLSTTA
jgi:hypothetical protein